jgi:hypothetical protein
MATFWLVWGEGLGRPTFKHSTVASATSEAERLTSQFPGRRFHVLKSIGSVVKREINWTWDDAEPGNPEIPF